MVSAILIGSDGQSNLYPPLGVSDEVSTKGPRVQLLLLWGIHPPRPLPDNPQVWKCAKQAFHPVHISKGVLGEELKDLFKSAVFQLVLAS